MLREKWHATIFALELPCSSTAAFQTGSVVTVRRQFFVADLSHFMSGFDEVSFNTESCQRGRAATSPAVCFVY